MSVKYAIVTGYSSGIGKAISQELETNGYTCIALKSRLEDINALEIEIKQLLKEIDIYVLVNCAGFGMFEPHEEIKISDIKKMIDINLTAPIILTNLLLRSLKKTQGNIINITSIEATRHSRFSALYTATKSGLRDFGLALFEELRKSGVAVTSINPDITQTKFFDNLNFKPSDNEDTYIMPSMIAKTTIQIINSNSVITDITIRPQRFGINKK